MKSLMGIYKSLFCKNIPVEFIHTKDLAQNSMKYKVIYVPFPITLSDEASQGN
jgi:hypothetical protein